MGLPRYLLARPRNRLTDRERADRDRHAEIGERLLRVDDEHDDVALAVRHHHERFDGRGTPDGLRGEGIPLGARIVALADLHDRSYREAAVAGASAARSRSRRALRAARGTLLDPGLVDGFLEGAVLRSDGREIQIRVDELREGMVLTRDLRTCHDLFLASGGTRLDRGHIERIRAFHRRNPILAEVFVRAG